MEWKIRIVFWTFALWALGAQLSLAQSETSEKYAFYSEPGVGLTPVLIVGDSSRPEYVFAKRFGYSQIFELHLNHVHPTKGCLAVSGGKTVCVGAYVFLTYSGVTEGLLVGVSKWGEGIVLTNPKKASRSLVLEHPNHIAAQGREEKDIQRIEREIFEPGNFTAVQGFQLSMGVNGGEIDDLVRACVALARSIGDLSGIGVTFSARCTSSNPTIDLANSVDMSPRNPLIAQARAHHGFILFHYYTLVGNVAVETTPEEREQGSITRKISSSRKYPDLPTCNTAAAVVPAKLGATLTTLECVKVSPESSEYKIEGTLRFEF
jgi:hypothetical protein